MREIEQVKAFKHDLKREARGRYAKTLKTDLGVVLRILAEDEPLAPHYRDHALTGNWHGCRDCHIKPDLVLMSMEKASATADAFGIEGRVHAK